MYGKRSFRMKYCSKKSPIHFTMFHWCRCNQIPWQNQISFSTSRAEITYRLTMYKNHQILIKLLWYLFRYLNFCYFNERIVHYIFAESGFNQRCYFSNIGSWTFNLLLFNRFFFPLLSLFSVSEHYISL